MSLEHSYRRLLRAYPPSYRERRGEEIIATLMDDALPGQTRPDRGASADLILGGVRERLGLHNPSGYAAGAALVAPICLTLAALTALTVKVGGPQSLTVDLAVSAWLLAAALWAAIPRYRRVVVALAFGATLAALLLGREDVWPVGCWGLATLGGCLSVAGPSAHRSSVGRFGVPMAVALLGALSLWWPVPHLVGDEPLWPSPGPTWSGVVNDLVVFGAVVWGVAGAGVRHSARVAWATFALLGTWAAAGGAWTSYLWTYYYAYGLPVGLAIEGPLVLIVLLTTSVLLIVVVVIAQRMVAGHLLHRAGGVVMGLAGALVFMPLLEPARGDNYSVWGEAPRTWDTVSPLWIGLLTLGALPAVVDRWAPAWVQRALLGAAIIAVGSAAVLVPAQTGPVPVQTGSIPYVLTFLVIGLCTRRAGAQDLGALTGFGLGLTFVVLVFLPSVTTSELMLLDNVRSVIWLAVLMGIVAGPAVALTAGGHVWLGAASVAVGALQLIALYAGHLFPLMVLGVVLGLCGLGLHRFRYVRPRPAEPPQEPA